jgi:hypothetical protein
MLLSRNNNQRNKTPKRAREEGFIPPMEEHPRSRDAAAMVKQLDAGGSSGEDSSVLY